MSISAPSIRVGCLIGSEGSHRSTHSLIELHFSTYQWAPFSNTSHPSRMLARAQDALLPFLASKNKVLGKYLSFSTITHNKSGSWIIRQHCLAGKAKLNSWRFLKSIPPCCLGKLRDSQLTQWTFLSYSFRFHQNWASIKSKSLHKDKGNLKIFFRYTSTACVTTFMRAYLPTCESKFCFQPWIFLNIFSFT